MDYTNISNIHVECGLAFGAATRKNGHDSLIFEPEAWYTQPIYSCASTVKANIKTVQSKYNSTVGDARSRSSGPDMRASTVQSIKAKEYPDKESMSLWGAETVNFVVHDLTHLWGLVSPEHRYNANLTTRRTAQLHLPGKGGTRSAEIMGYQFIPGTSGPANVLAGVYADSVSDLCGGGIVDYSGSSNMAMLSKWREYSKNETTLSRIMHLIWTDIAANMLVGTRNWNTKSNLPPNLQKRDGVAQLEETPVCGHHLRAPDSLQVVLCNSSLLSLALVALITIAALLLMLFGGGTPSRVDYYLKHLSSGRLLVAAKYPAEDKEAPTKVWIKQVGRRQSDLHRHGVAYGAPSLSTPFSLQPTAYPEKPPVMVTSTDQPLNGGSPSKGRYANVDSYDRPADEIFGQAR